MSHEGNLLAHVQAHLPGARSVALAARQHRLVADEPVPLGGDTGPAPYELLLASLGACTSLTLRMYAERKGWELGEVDVRLVMVRDGEVERVERTLRFGAALADDQKARLLEIAGKTPVTKTLLRAVGIETKLG